MEMNKILKGLRIGIGFLYFAASMAVLAIFVIMMTYSYLSDGRNPGLFMLIFPIAGAFAGKCIRDGRFVWWTNVIIVFSIATTTVALSMNHFVKPIIVKEHKALSKEDSKSPADLDLIRAVSDSDLNGCIAAINAGANVNVIDNEGIPVIHLALYSDSSAIALTLISHPKADVNIRDRSGQTPLHLATDPAIVRELIARGADLDAKEKDFQMTPIFFKELPIAKLLVEAGANIHARSEKGNTIIMWYAYSGYLEGMKYFVSQGVDINAVNEDGQTALEIAETFYKKDVIDYLKSQGAIKKR